MPLKSDGPFDKLSRTHAELFAAIKVIAAYGRPSQTKKEKLDSFDLAVERSIDTAAMLAESLGDFLCEARLDEQIARVEMLREARRTDTQPPIGSPGIGLWRVWESIHEEIEARRDANLFNEVQRAILHKVLGLVSRELEQLR